MSGDSRARPWQPDVASAGFWPQMSGQLPALAPLAPSRQSTAIPGWPQNHAAAASAQPPPATASSSRKRKAPTLRDTDWEPKRARVTQLYIEENVTIARLREALSEEFHFQPTERQIMSRIQKWGLDKKVKPAESLFMSRKLKHRRTHEPEKPDYVFTVRGKMQPPEKRERWEKRMGASQGVFSPCSVPATPDDVSYKTPEGSNSILNTPTLPTSVPMHPFINQPSTPSPNGPIGPAFPLAATPSLVANTQFGIITSPPLFPTPSPFFSTPRPLADTHINGLSLPGSPMASTPGLVADTGFEGASPAPWNDDVHEVICAITGPDSAFESPPETASGYFMLQKQAEDLERKISALELSHGNNSAPALEAMSGLFSNLWEQGRYKSAERLGRQILLGHRERGETERTASTLADLADVFLQQEYLQRAERAATKALGMLPEASGRESFTAFRSRLTLGKLQSKQGRFEKAKETFLSLLELIDRLPIPARLRMKQRIIIMSSMSFIAGFQGRLGQAEQWATKSVELSTREQVDDIKVGLYARGRLTFVWLVQARYDEARKMALECIVQCEKFHGPEHQSTASWMAALGRTYTGLGQWEEAQSCLRASASVRRKVLNHGHLEVLQALTDMLYMYVEQEVWDQAQIVLTEYRPALHEDLRVHANVRILEAAIVDGRGQPGQAIEIFPRPALHLKNLEPLFRIYASNIEVRILRNLGRLGESEEFASRTFDTSNQIFGPDHPVTLRSKDNLARTQMAKGATAMAIQSMRECVQSLSSSVGPEHYLTLRSQETLKEWTQSWGQEFDMPVATPQVLDTPMGWEVDDHI
ncbi:hypothetical protein B0T14DRAFT_602277 [Immersiella caudata]|uniref:Clr5 domain-containing protein n=1 Tax=Immersiella caudata TaxID=314043 RepID=A0AA39WY71_9PEZI|nr:hypothetical protein B0T14DRAFT_602277 [Immersiella caudata]